MALRRLASRWVAAGVLAAVGLTAEGAAQAQQGVLAQNTGSVPQNQVIRIERGGAPAVSAAPITALPYETVLKNKVPDDGLGVAAPMTVAPGTPMPSMLPNASAPIMHPATGMAMPVASAPCTTCGTAGAPKGDGFDWAKVPPVPVRPAPGFFIVFPTDPGYYTGLDWLLGNEREKPPAYPYPRFCLNAFRFYDFSFAYLDNPNNTETDPLDPLKRIHLGDNFLLSLGGEFRYRHLGSGDYVGNARGVNNYIDQYRTRLYADLWFQDIFRVYAEALDARIDHFRRPLTFGLNDVDHLDLHNAFVDVKIPFLDEGTKRSSYVRVGRQELLLGSQRLVSPVEFSNTRVNFQGISAFSHGETFDIDLFAVNPVLHQVDKFDSVDDKQLFLGSWLTYRPMKGQAAELYYLKLSNDTSNFTGLRGAKGGFDVNTIGSRYSGNYNNFLWDFEGMFQYGEFVNQNLTAGATVAEVGYHFKDLPMSPQFWLGYDWASGGGTTGSTRHTFNQLFAFGHYYFGQVDVVGRQNINDLSGQFVFFPSNWITAVSQFHAFYLDNARDSLYNAGGVATRTSANGVAGTNVGTELDFLLNFHLTNHQDIQFGYSHFWAGSFMRATGSGKDIDYGYAQYTFRF